MSWSDRIVWREGMFLRPQHFQQQDRYLHCLLEGRVGSLQPYPWGIRKLEIDQSLLIHGKLALSYCEGVFDDGTPFQYSDERQEKLVLDIGTGAAGTTVYLALLRTRPGELEVNSAGDTQKLTRHLSTTSRINDSNSESREDAELETARLRLRLVLERDRLSDDSFLGVARVSKVEEDGTLVLDQEYIPPCLDCHEQPRIKRQIVDIAGLLRVRAEYLAKRITEGTRGGVSEVVKYFMLQLVNRYDPLFTHWENLPGLHPLQLYETALQLAGELSAFNQSTRRPPTFPSYRHDRLDETLRPVIKVITEELTKVPEETAAEIPLKSDRYNFYVAMVDDIDLQATSAMVLAAKADMPTENLRRDFPPLVTIGEPQTIARLVKSHLPGVGLFPLPTTPPQIPFHAGYTYFELDRNSNHWKGIEKTKSIAFHVPEKFPGLALSLWVIKG
jgi:type VI secretion system protein ImpJ